MSKLAALIFGMRFFPVPSLFLVSACDPVKKTEQIKETESKNSNSAIEDVDDAALYMKSQSSNLLNESVFNWQFYLQANPDLLRSGLRTFEQAKKHWLKSGAEDGRQAHPAFHSKQYLKLYRKVSDACQKDRYKCAIESYLTFGAKRRHSGFFADGRYGRYTLSNGVVTLSASERVGGAIDSLFVGNREFLNSFDHGRQLQVAFSKNALGECYNPTEGGQERDGLGPKSSSILEFISVSGNVLKTRNRPAFWLQPRQESIAQRCGGARNTTNVSDYRFEKTVTISWNNNPNVIEFIIKVMIPENEGISSYVFEGPTGYLTADFTSYYTFSNGILTAVAHDPMGEQALPLVFATPDGSAAMGTFSPDFSGGNFEGPRYGKFAFLGPSEMIDKTNKWNIVFRKGATPAGTYSFRSFIVVGTLEQVRSQMTAVTSQFR